MHQCYVDAAHLDDLDPINRYEMHKEIIKEVASRARNLLLADATVAAKFEVMHLATAARLVLYNNAHTAENIIQKSPTIARHIQVIDGITSFTDQPRYETELAFAKSRALDDEMDTIREIIKLDNTSYHSKKLANVERKSRMWRAGTRKIFLSALEISPEHIVHEEKDITNGLRDKWQPIFQKKPNQSIMESACQKLKQFVPDLSDDWKKFHRLNPMNTSCTQVLPPLQCQALTSSHTVHGTLRLEVQPYKNAPSSLPLG